MIAPVPTRRDEDKLDWQENQGRGSGCWADRSGTCGTRSPPSSSSKERTGPSCS